MLKFNLLPDGLLVLKDGIGIILFITFKELQFKRVPFLFMTLFLFHRKVIQMDHNSTSKDTFRHSILSPWNAVI